MLLNHGGARLATEGGLKFSVKPLKFSAKPKLFISWDCTESYLPQRFWREGWMCNKTLQKLHGTNPGIRISSDSFL